MHPNLSQVVVIQGNRFWSIEMESIYTGKPFRPYFGSLLKPMDPPRTNSDHTRSDSVERQHSGPPITTQVSSNDGADGHQTASIRTSGRIVKEPVALLHPWPRPTWYQHRRSGRLLQPPRACLWGILPSPHGAMYISFLMGGGKASAKNCFLKAWSGLCKICTRELVLQAEAKSPLVSTAVTATCASLVFTSAELDVLNTTNKKHTNQRSKNQTRESLH